MTSMETADAHQVDSRVVALGEDTASSRITFCGDSGKFLQVQLW